MDTLPPIPPAVHRSLSPADQATYEAAFRSERDRLAQCLPELDTTDHAEPTGPAADDEAAYRDGLLLTPAELAEWNDWRADYDRRQFDRWVAALEPENYDGHGSAWGGHPAETY